MKLWGDCLKMKKKFTDYFKTVQLLSNVCVYVYIYIYIYIYIHTHTQSLSWKVHRLTNTLKECDQMKFVFWGGGFKSLSKQHIHIFH